MENAIERKREMSLIPLTLCFDSLTGDLVSPAIGHMGMPISNELFANNVFGEDGNDELAVEGNDACVSANDTRWRKEA